MATFNAGAIEATLDLDVDPFQRGIAQARAEGRKFGQEKFTATLDLDTRKARSDAQLARREFERLAQTYSANFEARGLAATTAHIEALNEQLEAVSRKHTIDVETDQAVVGVNRLRGGIRALIPALAILSTGLIPLTAAAVPVLGLASNFALATGAAGTLMLAFQGMGDALTAANEAGIEPSAENLEKLHAAMSKLTPAGREFVGVIQQMRSEGAALQDAASNGLFPGLNRGLNTVQLENYVGLVFELSDTMGDLAGRTLEALGNPRWTQFFAFIESEARPGIDALGTSVGNLAGFFASLWQAFDPLNDDLSEWLVSSTGALQGWADALPSDPVFQDFIAYVREVGPQAADTIGAVASALIQVVQAAAPLGGAVLQGLELFAELVGFIADTPFGPVLIAGAAGLYAINRALATTEALMTRMGMTGAAAGGKGAAAGGMFAAFGSDGKAGAGLRTIVGDLKNVARYGGLATESAERLRGTLGTMGKAAGAVAGVALITSGMSDSLGVTSTAMGVLTGAMVGGVPGAIAGGAIGAFMDFHKAANIAADASKAFEDAIDNQFTSLSQYQTAVDDLRTAHDNYARSIPGILSTGFSALGELTRGNVATSADEVPALKEMIDAEREAAQATGDLQLAASLLGKEMGITGHSTTELDTALRNAQPAMQALGMSSADLIAGVKDGSIVAMVDQLAAWQIHADSAAGRTEAFGKSVADLGEDALSTAASAAAMGNALEALLSPALDAEAATDAWRVSLKGLRAELDDAAGFKGFNEAAIANRQLTRDYVTDSMDRLKALAAVSTTTERDMAAAVRETRAEFIRSGIAAGFSRKEITARADAIGLTPKLVRTAFQAAGITQVDLRARKLRETYKALPKDVRTDIQANGIPETSGEVDRLVAKYKLTEKQRQALITLKDLASKPIGDVLDKLNITGRTRAAPSVVLDGASAVTGALSGIMSWLDRIDGTTATSTIITRRIESKEKALAGGGPVIGPGTSTSDSIPAWLSNNEHVWTAREVANAGGHAAVEALRAQFRYAAGGAVVPKMPRTPAGALSSRQWAAIRATQAATSSTGGGLTAADVDRIVAAIENNRGVFAHVSSKEDLEAAMRALGTELRRR